MLRGMQKPRTLLSIAAALVLAASCSAGTHDEPKAEPAAEEALPSGSYRLVYAMQFVEAMRRSDKKAGAYEISSRPDDDGIYTVTIDVFEQTVPSRLIILLTAKDGGLEPQSATLGKQAIYPDPPAGWTKFLDWHAAADRRARTE